MYIPFRPLSFHNIVDYIQKAVQPTTPTTQDEDRSLASISSLSYGELASSVQYPLTQSTDRTNLLIFDWDDTIFPTNVIKKQIKKTTINSTKFNEQMNELVTCLKHVFQQLIQTYGSKNILIVTNSTYPWIYNTCTQFPAFKTFIQFLKQNNIEIISARSDYGHIDTECMSKWKEFAFEDIFSKYFPMSNDNDNDNDIVNCITSIGDSYYEFNASEYASENINNCILNRIKFKNKPSIYDIINQMQNILAIKNKFGICAEDMQIMY